MLINQADYLTSNTDVAKLPAPKLPEYAFIGRSNVGKSSLINSITQRKGLAKTSGKPGKTITINHFLINESWYLVDLPGYGFAKRSKTARENWKKMLDHYLQSRKNLIYTFVLVDSRLAPQPIDMEFIQWMGMKQLPFVIVFTKSDKLGKTKLSQSIGSYKKELLRYWEELPVTIVSSAEKDLGREEILSLIQHENNRFQSYSNSIIS